MDFRYRVEWARRIYFDAILPRYIDAHFRGAGYAFVYALLADHDVADLLKMLDEPEPSPRAVRMSRGAERMVAITAVDWLPEPPCYGLFTRTDRYESMMGVDFRELGSEFSILLFEPAFLPLRDDPDRLDGELLFTLFHEMVHYFESFLPASERPLALREEGVTIHLTAEEAVRRDTWVIVRRYGSWGLIVGGVFATAFGLAWSMA